MATILTHPALLADEPENIHIDATFTCYGHTEQVRLEVPANFWQLSSADRAEIMDDEYDTWCDGGREPWSIETEEPEKAAA
ncbi:hypothetical protein LRS06_21735 [Hymenobacter sp. J193]|uniref:hypothetical protein n=1 Tax=Hymenobacter sp. J193 TaxID=2898429 RepID=UPI002150FCD4|nr:hypothetical protein [Hymenobacter sp. J193]MCR5890352.1 hypothetical protein [Hymenobacter sp. J193]